ncbi:MAG: preprotein translocase subunit SecE [Candidatus Omnitrophica bacterium]|nr:preprotein translocase subunit SecE [Candidatus Omnitrophota bacterium]
MFGKIGTFFQETRQELNKVTWPSRNELWQSTVVVIVTTFIMATYIGFIDFCLSIVIRVLVR